MTLGIDNLGALDLATGPPARTRFVASTTVDPHASLRELDRSGPSDGFPPELRAEVDFAFRRADELASQNRELHFEKDEASGRIVVQVRDLDGTVIRTIPGAEAFDILSGDALA